MCFFFRTHTDENHQMVDKKSIGNGDRAVKTYDVHKDEK